MQGKTKEKKNIEQATNSSLSTVSLLEAIANNTMTSKVLLEKQNNTLDSINLSFQNISRLLSQQEPISSKPNTTPKLKLENANFSEPEQENDVIPYLKSIVELLEKIAGGKKSVTKEKKSKKVKKGKQSDIKVDASNISGLAKSLESLEKSLSKQLNMNLKVFISLLKTMGSKRFKKDMTLAAASISVLTSSVAKIGDSLKNVGSNFFSLFKNIFLFTLLVRSPIFEMTVEKLKQFFDVLNSKPKAKTKEAKKPDYYKWLFMSIAVGIVAVVGALMLIKNVGWGDLLKLLTFLTALAGIVYLFTLNQKGKVGSIKTITKGSNNANNKFGSNGILGIAIGLAILALSIASFKEIDWIGAVTLLAFMAGLSAILIVSKIIIGKRNGGGILGFAFGIAILLLTIAAADEVFGKDKHTKFDITNPNTFNQGAFMIIAFILLVALAIRVGTGSGGGTFKGVFGFAMSVAVLVLCVYAIREMMDKDPEGTNAAIDKLLYFVFGISIAIAIASGNWKKTKPLKKNNLTQFVWAVASLILAFSIAFYVLDSIKNPGQVVLMAFVLTVMFAIFAGGLIGINEYLNKGNLNTPKRLKKLGAVLGIIVGIILTMTAVVFSLSLIDPSPALKNASIMIGIFAVFTLGIGWINRQLKKEGLDNKKKLTNLVLVLGTIVGVILLMSTSMYILGAVNDNNLLVKSQIMTLVMLEFTIMLGLLSYFIDKVLKNNIMAIGVATAVMFGISVIVNIMASAMKTLGEVNGEDLGKKAFVMSLVMLGFLAMVIGLGAVIAIPVIGPMLLVGAAAITGLMLGISFVVKTMAEAMVLIGQADVDKEKSENWAVSSGIIVKGIVEAITAIGFRDAAKFAVKGLLLQDVFKLAYQSALVMRAIEGLRIDDTQMQAFTTTFGTFLNTFLDSINEEGKTAIGKMGESTQSLMGIIGMAKNFVDVIEALENAQIKTYEVKNGEMVLTDVRKLDLEKVSKGAGEKLATIFTDFLNVMSENLPDFKRKDKKKYERISDSLNGFGPLFDQISNLLSHSETLADASKMTSIGTNLNGFVLSIINTTESIDGMTQPNYMKLNSIIKFIESFQKTDWDKSSKGIKVITDNVIKMVDKINCLNLNKALALKDTLALFTQVKLNNDTREAMNRIIEMLDKISGYDEIISKNQGDLNKSAQDIAKQTKATTDKLKESANSAITGDILMANLESLYIKLESLINGLSGKTYKSNIVQSVPLETANRYGN